MEENKKALTTEDTTGAEKVEKFLQQYFTPSAICLMKEALKSNGQI